MKQKELPYLRRAGDYWIFEMKINNKTQHIAGRFSTRYLLEKVIGKEKAYQYYQKSPIKEIKKQSKNFAQEKLSELLKEPKYDTPDFDEETKNLLWEISRE